MIRKAAIIVLIVSIMLAVASCSKDSSTGPKDKAGPTVSIVTPWDATTRYGVVDVTANAADDAGINRVEFYVNNHLIGADNTEPYAVEWDMDALADGSQNTVFAKAVDANGNATTSESVTVTKGVTSAPVAKMTGPSDGRTIKQGDELNFKGTAADDEDGDLAGSNISWSSSIMGKIAQGSDVKYRGLSIGQHVITMTATDSNGMTDTQTATVTVTENNLDYGVIAPGTYYIGAPLFTKSAVVLTKTLYVWKKEMTTPEFMEMYAIL